MFTYTHTHIIMQQCCLSRSVIELVTVWCVLWTFLRFLYMFVCISRKEGGTKCVCACVFVCKYLHTHLYTCMCICDANTQNRSESFFFTNTYAKINEKAFAGVVCVVFVYFCFFFLILVNLLKKFSNFLLMECF